jgi:hypothetical protein
MYSVTAYFFGKVISEIPASIVIPVLFGCISYYSIGLDSGDGHGYKFPLFCKKKFYFNQIYSGYFNSDLLHWWKLCTYHFIYLL